jgi:anti-sigma regulatory factor (Ser/Thr protein kinase)
MSQSRGAPVIHARPWSCETTFPPDARSASSSRTFVRLRLADHDLLHLCEQVELVTSELVTNAIQHAQTPFTVSLRDDGEGAVMLTVTDSGRFELRDHERREFPDWTTPDGRGLLIAGSLSSGWGVDRGYDGTTAVWACFDAARPTVRR